MTPVEVVTPQELLSAEPSHRQQLGFGLITVARFDATKFQVVAQGLQVGRESNF